VTTRPNTPAPVAEEIDGVAARAVHMMGADAERAWTGDEPMAWEGLLEISRRLRRGAEDLLAEDDLSVSMLGIMGRLLRADAQTLRQTVLAEALGLSVSRASRVIDLLERRELVERHACPTDARATNVTLTRRGLERTAHAQQRLFAYVQPAFVEQLTPRELATLASVFARLMTTTS
jgi:DNA-binding MarR family transcriptional regulator